MKCHFLPLYALAFLPVLFTAAPGLGAEAKKMVTLPISGVSNTPAEAEEVCTRAVNVVRLNFAGASDIKWTGQWSPSRDGTMTLCTMMYDEARE